MSPVSPVSPGEGSPDVHTPPLLLAFLDSNVNAHPEQAGHFGGVGGRRPALASNTNTAQSAGGAGVGKRRKVREHELEQEGEGRRGLGDEEKEQGILPGCGRVVCRGCSFETPERYVDVGLLAFVLWIDPPIF